MKCPNLIVRLLALAFATLGSGPVWGSFTWNGNVSPSNPSAWGSATLGYIGETSDGAISVNDGSKLLAGLGYLGSSPSANGEVTVTGTNSEWMVTYGLAVGDVGSGTMNVQAGGKVSVFDAASFLGKSYGSTGVVNITGAGSHYLNRGDLYVGNDGVGIANVQDGGRLENKSEAFLGDSPGSTGDATVSGNGSWWSNSSALYIGREGTGTLNIESGGRITDAAGFLGWGIGSTGEVTVTGAGSMWSNNSGLYVGREGSGTLKIQAGGTVINYLGISILGESLGSTGEVTVTGTDSHWTNRRYLIVGGYGQATLKITHGGLVSVGLDGLIVDEDLSGADSFVDLSSGGMLALKSDETGDDSLTDFLALVGGTKAIRYWDDAISDWAAISAAIYGEDYTLEYVTTGDLAG